MTTKVSTALALSAFFVGRAGFYSAAPHEFPICVLNARIALGNLKLQVRQLGKSGSLWVDSRMIRLVSE